MATIDICDVCGTDIDVKKRQFSTGRTYNGVDYSYDSETIDLCIKCELELYKVAVTSLIINRELGVVVDARNKFNKEIISAFNRKSEIATLANRRKAKP